MHSAFSVTFGVLMAAAFIYFLISKSKTSKKFFRLTIAFVLYAVIAAVCLKQFLGGTAEIIAITAVLIATLIVNHTNIMLENEGDVPVQEAEPEMINEV